MSDKRKNTRTFTKTNPEVSLYTELPHVGRKNQAKKKGDPNQTWKPRDSVYVHSQYQPVIERESSSINYESETTRLLGEVFTIPLLEERIYQDK